VKALLVEPKAADSLRFEDIREPPAADGDLLVSALALGVCGTDRELVAGLYGSPPPGHKRLVIGHESLGIVEESPASSPIRPGDLVVPFVRLPDPVPCDCCSSGEWDRCRNDGFTEHGIKAVDGFARERYRVDSRRVMTIDRSLGIAGVLVEPASVVANAWSKIDAVTVGACWTARRILVTGAGPVGLLATMMGAQRGLDVHVFDRATDGIKPSLAREIGATYHSGGFDQLPVDFDILIECTGADPIIAGASRRTAPDGVVCLVGVAGKRPAVSVDVAALNDSLVLGNRVMLGSVNANRSHYEAGRNALMRADRRWLERLITRRVPFADAPQAFAVENGGVKTVVVFDRATGVIA
jgi:threonine dehydrogenase-like Zn-dependent dehydrogenase